MIDCGWNYYTCIVRKSVVKKRRRSLRDSLRTKATGGVGRLRFVGDCNVKILLYEVVDDMPRTIAWPIITRHSAFRDRFNTLQHFHTSFGIPDPCCAPAWSAQPSRRLLEASTASSVGANLHGHSRCTHTPGDFHCQRLDYHTKVQK